MVHYGHYLYIQERVILHVNPLCSPSILLQPIQNQLHTAEILVDAGRVQNPASRPFAQLHKLLISIESLDELVALGQPLRALGVSADADNSASGSDAAPDDSQSLLSKLAFARNHEAICTELGSNDGNEHATEEARVL
jgi:hypothetical protein